MSGISQAGYVPEQQEVVTPGQPGAHSPAPGEDSAGDQEASVQLFTSTVRSSISPESAVGTGEASRGAEVSASQASSTSPTSAQFKFKGGGMDKEYYHRDGDNEGFLKFKSQDAGKNQAVMARELTAYKSLKGIVPDNLPQIDHEKAPPQQSDLEGKQGYWVQHIPHDKTFKPKMMTFGINKDLSKTINGLNPGQKANLKSSLSEIKGKLPEISKHVGELSIAVDKGSGKAYLLDYAPNESGDVGGDDLAERAGQGLDKILGALK